MEGAGLEEQFSFAYGAIEEGGAIVGIVPIFTMDVPIDLVAPPMIARILRVGGRIVRRLQYQRTLFVGSPCTEEGSVGLLPGMRLQRYTPAIHSALQARAAQQRASMVVWKDFPATQSAALNGLAGSGVFRVASYPGTQITLNCPDFDHYLKTLNADRRYKLRNKLKRGRAMGALDVSIIQYPDERVLEDIFRLYWQTYKHGKTKFESLTPRFFQIIAQEPVSHFLLLRQADTGRLVAFMLLFKMGSHAINKYIGIDYSLTGDWFLYFRLWEHAVDFCARAGVVTLASSQGCYAPKLDFGHHLLPLNNYCRHRNPLLNRLFARIARDISWATLDPDLQTHLAAHPELAAS